MELQKLKEEWKSYCGKYYTIQRMYGCDLSRFNPNELFHSYNGFPFLSKRRLMSAYLDIIGNDGTRVLHTSFTNLPTIFSAFWCNGGKIGFITPVGGVSICRLNGEIVMQLDPPDSTEIFLYDSFFNGVAFLKKSGAIYVFDFHIRKIDSFGKIDFARNPNMMAFYRGQNNFAIILYDDGNVQLIDDSSTATIIAKISFPVHTIAFSTDGSYISLSGATDCTVITQTGKEIIQISISDPAIVKWASSTSLFVATDVVTMYDVNGQTAEIDCPVPCYVNQDSDHLRLFTRDGVYVVAPVSAAVTSLVEGFKAGRIKLLCEAYNQFSQRDVQSYSTVLSVKDNLDEVIDWVLDAALHLTDPFVQEYLMKVAAFGQYCSPTRSSESYVTTMKQIRLLNTLRTPEFSMTTTADSLKQVSPSQIAELCIGLRFFGLASKICQLFNFSSTQVAEQWAIAMFKEHGEPALSTVISKLETIPGVDFLRVCQNAQNRRFTRGSLMALCNLIVSPKQRLQFMATIPNSDPLAAAIELRDGDSIITIMCVKRILLDGPKFAELLCTNEVVRNHYALFKKYQDPARLGRIEHMKNLAPTMLVHEFPTNFGRNNKQLDNLIAMDPVSVFAKYMKRQRDLNAIGNGTPEVRDADRLLSPREVMVIAFRRRARDVAQQIGNLYNVPARTFNMIALQTFASEGMWDCVEDLEKAKDLGLDDLALACYENGNVNLGRLFVEHMGSAEKQLSFYETHGMEDRAALLRQQIENQRATAKPSHRFGKK